MVSIVVPIYNIEKFLPECIESIINQSYQDWELLLVDDGSPDGSGAICDKYTEKDERIKVIHKKNGGVTAARRSGVEAAKGEWIFFVDGDDKVEKDGLLRLVEAAKGDESLDIVEGTYAWFFPDGQKKSRVTRAHKEGQVNLNALDYANGLYTEELGARGPWSKIIKKEVILSSKAFSLPRDITNREDAMMLTAIALEIRNYLLIDVPVYLYRSQYTATAVSNKLTWKYWERYLRFLKNDILKDCSPEWNSVFEVTAVDVFKIAVHGNTRFQHIPPYFYEDLLPLLKKEYYNLSVLDKLYIKAFKAPAVIRSLMIFPIQGFQKIRLGLLSGYYAKRSRK